MVKGALIQPKPKGVFDLDIEHAGPLHLPVGKPPIKLKDSRHGQKGRGNRRAAVVTAIHTIQVGLMDEWRDQFLEFTVEAILGDQLLAHVIGVVKASLITRPFEQFSLLVKKTR